MNVKVTIELEIEDLDNRQDLEDYLYFEFGRNASLNLNNVYLNSENDYDIKYMDIKLD